VRVRTLAGEPDRNDAIIMIPLANKWGTYEQRVERAVRWLWSRGIYPGPAAVSMRLRGYAQRSINGKETKVRNRLMRELGIQRQRKDTRFAREVDGE